MNRGRVRLDVERHADHLVVHWSTRDAVGEVRFDRLDGTVPEWLAAEDDVVADIGSRGADALLDAIAAWADAESESVGVWRDDAGVELLTLR